MDIPQDPKARSPKIRGGIGEILVDLGEPSPEYLIGEREIRESEGQNQDGGGAAQRNSRAVEHQQISDRQEYAGHGRRKHADEVDETVCWERSLVDEEGRDHCQECGGLPRRPASAPSTP